MEKITVFQSLVKNTQTASKICKFGLIVWLEFVELKNKKKQTNKWIIKIKVILSESQFSDYYYLPLKSYFYLTVINILFLRGSLKVLGQTKYKKKNSEYKYFYWLFNKHLWKKKKKTQTNVPLGQAFSHFYCSSGFSLNHQTEWSDEIMWSANRWRGAQDVQKLDLTAVNA